MACGSVISVERPPEGLGLPPPVDYEPCYVGEARAYDRNGDGKFDEVRVTFKGRERCYGDFNLISVNATHFLSGGEKIRSRAGLANGQAR